MAFGWCSSSGVPSSLNSCSPVSTEAWSASSSMRSSGSVETKRRPVAASVASATWFRIHLRSRSSTVLFFLTTNSHGRCSGEMEQCWATFVLKSPLFLRLVAQFGTIFESLSISPTPIGLMLSPVIGVS